MKNRLLFFIFSITLFLGSCEKNANYFENLKQLEGGKTFAVPTGTAADQFVLKRFSDARIVYYNTVLDCALAVKGGKADAAVYDKPVLKNIAAKNEGLIVLDELLLPDSYGFAVDKKNASLKAAMDEVLAKLKSDGTYNDMLERWFPEKGGHAPMPEISFEGTDGLLVFGTSAFTEPMTYFSSDQKIVGFDIEFAQRIAKHLNKKLEIVNMEFGAMLPALISGKVEMVGAGLSITEERAKSVLFSESYYESGLAALVNLPPKSTVAQPSVSENLKEQWTEIGVLMGSIHESYALKNYPGKKVLSYNSVPDMLMALNSGKVQGAFMDHTSVREVLSANENFDLLQSNLFSVDIAAGFNKKSIALKEEFNRFLAEIKADGTYDAMVKRWHEDVGASMPEITNPDPVGE
ncbi:MAG: transporter substrate-binding domain-containing protein, partial [Bacteroidales bacterium]|nr:transporter substrate-binding domain-containing protein [Bacteroidales bacterium]